MVGVTEEPQLEIYQVAESVHHHNQINPEKNIMQTTDHVYVYLCVCVLIYMCVHVLALCACVCMYVYMSMFCVCLCTCVCLHAFMCVSTCMCLLITENILLNTSITYAMTFIKTVSSQ